MTNYVKDMCDNYSVLLLDTAGYIQKWEGNLPMYNGYSAEEIRGKHYRTFYTQKDIEDLIADDLLKCAAKNRTSAYHGYQVRKDGTDFEGNIVVAARFDSEQVVTGFSVTTFNITQQHSQVAFNHYNLEALIDNTSSLVWSIDTNYKLITANKAFDEAIRQMTGCIIEKGDDVLAIGFSKEQQEKYRMFYDRALGGEKFTELEYTAPPFELWSEISFHPIVQDNVITGTACHAHNITEAKKAEKLLFESEYKFRSLIENSADGIVLFTADFKPFYISPSVTTLLGYEQEDVRGIELVSLTHPDDIAALQRLFEKVLANPGIPIQGHTSQLRHKDGSWRWMEATVTNMLHDPAINGIVDNFRDVTDRKIDELKIRHANRLYAVISQINQTIVQVKDKQTLFNKVCEIATKFGAFKAAWIGIINPDSNTIDLTAQSGQDITSFYLCEKEDYNQQAGVWQELKRSQHYLCNNIQESHKSASCKLIASAHGIRSYMVFPIKQSGEIIGIFNLYSEETGFFKDQEIGLLTEVTGDILFALDVFRNDKNRLAAVIKLKHSTFRLKQAQAIAHFGSWELDFANGVGIWSEELCRIYGLDLNDNLQTYDEWFSFIHPDDATKVKKIADEDMASLSSSNFYHRIIRKDGAVRYIQALSHFDLDADGKPIGMYGTAHDITEQTYNVMKLNAQNDQLRKIADIQSHRVRGPVATILGLAQLLKKDKVDDENWQILEGIVTSTEKLDTVIREIVLTTYLPKEKEADVPKIHNSNGEIMTPINRG